ncbi:uncharacterized protein LOC117290102 [Asterias rubens]|uniref:uncharacterized protein LOC117290102 n=1 Tax=Asterias rubens TaxID=7604 RepID=UPI00145571BC|nr:uncharacterized protein LOC117290102 [Asterias rubens]
MASLVTTRKYPQIDLEKEIPPLDEISKRTVIVTAISSNHYKEGKVMISTAQNVMPNTRIVVCDLGLIPSEIREYPPHVKDLLNYAWKPALINELLYEFGAVFWADSSVDIDTFRKDTGFTPKPRGGILYFVNSSYINEKLLQPWVDCSMVIECIAPHGSQNPHKKKMKGYYVHRYDQSALAILMYKNVRYTE